MDIPLQLYPTGAAVCSIQNKIQDETNPQRLEIEKKKDVIQPQSFGTR